MGAYAIQQGTVTAGANYAITFVPDSFSITAKTLTVTGVTVANKTYDRTTDATLSGATLSGVEQDTDPACGVEPGQGHYYRVQGPTFLLEYDNTQNGANHIHAAAVAATAAAKAERIASTRRYIALLKNSSTTKGP